MKQCPICGEVYSAQLQFCINDGGTLIGTSKGADEYETVLRSSPVVINLDEPNRHGWNQPASQSTNPLTQELRSNETIPEPKRGYGLLVLGIGIGGILVLGTILTMNALMPNTVAVAENPPANNAPVKNTDIENPKAENVNRSTTNHNGVASIPKQPEKTDLSESGGLSREPDT